MEALVIHWSLDPVLCRVGDWSLRWYTTLMVCTMIGAWFFAGWCARREGVSKEVSLPLAFWLLIGFQFGGKLGYRYFYAAGDFSGFSSFGCAAGFLLVTWLFAATTGRRKDMSFLWVLDRLMLCSSFCFLPIRFGNFCNSELCGTPTDLPWGVVFERLGDGIPRHPVQLYEGVALTVLALVLLWLYLHRYDKLSRGQLSALFFTVVSPVRFLTEFVKEAENYVDFGAFSLRTAQVLCIPLFALGIGILLHARRHPAPMRLRTISTKKSGELPDS